MKHFYLRFLSLCLLSVVGAKALAHDIEVPNADGKMIYYTWNNNKTELGVSCKGENGYKYTDRYSGNIVIPESVTYNGKKYSVTSIVGYAFCGCSGMTSLTIPNSVRSIGYLAFYGCTGLSSLTIPNSVTGISNYAFQGCTNIVQLVLNCKNVDNSFSDMQRSIKEVILGDGVETIGDNAFNGFSNLIKVTLSNSVTSIGSRAFYFCNGLSSIIIPSKVTSIGNSAFSGCTALKSVTILCDKVGSWFSGNVSINEIVLGDDVTSIGDGAFKGCSGLTSVIIPNSVTSFGSSAFQNCI